MASDPGSSSKPSLLTLPAEIRNHIFAMAVVDEDPLAFLNNMRPRILGKRFTPTDTVAAPIPPPLARTCRQARKEALPIFYGANTFVFNVQFPPFPKAWREGLMDLDPAVVEYVRKVVLRRRVDGLPARMMNEGADALELELTLDSAGEINMAYRRFYEDHCTCELEEAAREIVGMLGSDTRDALLVVAGIFCYRKGIVFMKPKELCGWPRHRMQCKCGKVTADSKFAAYDDFGMIQLMGECRQAEDIREMNCM